MDDTRSPVLSLVVVYKFCKAVIELVAVVMLVLSWRVQGWGHTRDMAAALDRDVLHGAGAALAHLLRTAASPDKVHLLAVVLGGDAVLSALEGFLLWRGYRWAREVIAAATLLPLPWELVRLVRRPLGLPLAFLLVNLGIFVYVLRAARPSAACVHRRPVLRRAFHAIAAAAGVGAVWAFLTYVLVPEFNRHRAFAREAAVSPKRTSDATGRPADPVNVGLFGDRAQVEASMRRAVWSPAAAITLRSVAGMAASVLLDLSYRAAPVSKLFLDGRPEDLAFEQQVGRNPRRRHHVRLWAQPGAPALWLGAATFDEGVEISARTGQLTHRTSPRIDDERRKLIGDLTAAGCVAAVHAVPGIGASSGARTADGQLFQTDGEIAVLQLTCR